MPSSITKIPPVGTPVRAIDSWDGMLTVGKIYKTQPCPEHFLGVYRQMADLFWITYDNGDTLHSGQRAFILADSHEVIVNSKIGQ